MSGTSPYGDLRSRSAHYRFRMLKDMLARYWVAFGGISVIIAIVLIFFYLFYVVFPLFVPASAEPIATYEAPGGGSTLMLQMEEHAELAVRYTGDGRAVFFQIADGTVVKQVQLPSTEESEVISVGRDVASEGRIALGLADGRALVVEQRFAISYPDDVRTITPIIEFPYGEQPLRVDSEGRPLRDLVVRETEDRMVLAAIVGESVAVADFAKESTFLSDEVTLERRGFILRQPEFAPRHLLLDTLQERLFAASRSGEVHHYELDGAGEKPPRLIEKRQITEPGVTLTSLHYLIGGISLLVGDERGVVSQWFPVRDKENDYALQWVRSFVSQEAPVEQIATEERRKGFVAVDANGGFGIYHTTAHHRVLLKEIGDTALRQVTVSPRANALLLEDVEGRIHAWAVHNEHPEISWHSLWEKVHYEGYSEPAHIWQSSSASNDFEPKFSLTPLSFGTLKAAFYAMLFAVPLAILGAIYTAYFMAPRMRQVVKPSIEIMEALPTVILGFLAGLWLAPLIEQYLPGFLALFLILPVGILLFAYLWHRMPDAVRRLVPAGWEAALLLPVLLLLGWAGFELSVPLEHLFFGGNIHEWLTERGISFDQRNSIVVGLAMGFAVIPTIFSITEDAIFSAPKHLTFGSLALGATPWQTLSRVVILTASPGIFSAVMIGLGRAVGETMIVLMATGNTPVMDFSIFQGMRTLSANIAVEMPESEVDSTHYRVLFLAALVLFLFTFFFNTLAELVRQRLRRRYASL